MGGGSSRSQAACPWGQKESSICKVQCHTSIIALSMDSWCWHHCHCAADGNYTWGSPLLPWEIAANGQQFVRDHLRMEDTLIYIR